MNENTRKALPDFIRRPIEEAIERAIHPKGMSVHDGKMIVASDKVAYLLAAYDAALAAAPQAAQAVPAGWKLVPVEPTAAMSAHGFTVDEAEHDPAGVYRAMVKAAPAPDAQAAQDAGRFAVLAQAVADAALKAGIVHADAALTGPHLLMLLDDMATAIAAQKSPEPAQELTP